jgi:general secretion pathway protein A
LTFFGFQRAPFELVPDPDFLYLGESHEAALANLTLGLESGKGFVVISGAVGTGKTTVLRSMLRRLGPDRKVCFLSQPEFGVADLLHAVLDGFDLPSEGMDVVEMRRFLRDFLVGRSRPGILILDEAHLLTEQALEQVRLLSNLEEENRKLLQIVFSGQPELKELLSRPRLRPLTQRIEMFYEILPLGLEDTFAYLERRLRIAGSPDGLVFEPRALHALHACTGGIPRLINILAERALVTAYVADARTIDEAIIAEAFDDLGEITQSVMPGRPQRGRSWRRPKASPPVAYAPPPPLPPRDPAGGTPTRPADRTPRAAEVVVGPEPTAAPSPRETPSAPAPAPEPPSGSSEPPSDPVPGKRLERWLAGGGIAAVILLALVSLGSDWIGVRSRAQAEPGPDAAAGVVPDLGTPTVAPEPIPPAAPEPIPPAAPEPSPDPGVGAGEIAAPVRTPALAIQVASFRELERARRFARQIGAEAGHPTRISPAEVETGLWYRVLVGECDTREDAHELMESLQELHDFSFLRPVELLEAPGRSVPGMEE